MVGDGAPPPAHAGVNRVVALRGRAWPGRAEGPPVGGLRMRCETCHEAPAPASHAGRVRLGTTARQALVPANGTTAVPAGSPRLRARLPALGHAGTRRPRIPP